METVGEKIVNGQSKVEQIVSADQPLPVNAEPVERMDGAFFSIICSSTIPCVLVLIFAGAFIGIILGTQFKRDDDYPELRRGETTLRSVGSTTVLDGLRSFKSTGGNAAFYINFNPSSLTAIAALTGKVLPYLSSSVMALVAFFAARRIIINSRGTNTEKLLSPRQLSMLIELLNGSSYVPLWDCIKYHLTSKQKWISPLPSVFTALTTVTFLG
jgi:hypothetical protein